VQSRDRDKELQSIGKKGQSIEEVNDLLWGYEDDITTKMEALSILCVCFYFHCSSIVHSLMQSMFFNTLEQVLSTIKIMIFQKCHCQTLYNLRTL
jgi:hypothetical protein